MVEFNFNDWQKAMQQGPEALRAYNNRLNLPKNNYSYTGSWSDDAGTLNDLPKTTDTGNSFLGMNKDQWGMASQGVNAVTGLASLYAGLQGLDLARDQLNFNKDQANKQYTMAKDAYDRNVARADSIAAQMRAGSANLKAVG